MAYKSFGSTSSALGEPVSFDLNGERFLCRQHIPLRSLLRLMKAGQAAGSADTVEELFVFLRSALHPSDVERFFALVDSEEGQIGLEDIGDITGWLAEVYSGGRPTGEPSSTTSSSPSTGDGSTAGASPGAPIYSRSQPTEH